MDRLSRKDLQTSLRLVRMLEVIHESHISDPSSVTRTSQREMMTVIEDLADRIEDMYRREIGEKD